MEFAISSQFGNLIRCAVAFIVIYTVLPAIIFSDAGDSRLERFFSGYVRMVAVTIVMGYILVGLKLYEVLSISFVFLLLFIFFKVPRNYQKHVFREMSVSFLMRVFDFLDSSYNDRYQLLRHYFASKFKNFTIIIRSINMNNSSMTVLFLCVLAYSAYLRFYDTIRHAAPSMADAYVILAWMKYIDDRILFHDGIYPQGFFIYLSVLHKFAANDALYILKYTGPLCGVLTTCGIYLFVVKITGRKLPGILSAFVFGVLGGILPYAWERQGATLTQEFALVFLFPAWYYAISFLQTGKKPYLWTTAAAFSAIALAHTLVLAFLWVGLVLLCSAYLLFDYRQTIRSVKYLIVTGIVIGVVSAFPVPIGLLAGKEFHSTSLDFLTETVQIKIPNIMLIDTLALIGFGLLLVISIWKRKTGSDLAITFFIFSLGLTSFLLYLFLGSLTQNLMFSARMGVLWALLLSVGVGIGAEALLQIIPGKQNMLRLKVASIIALFLMLGGVGYFKPSPAQPYKMQYDAEINQYLRIVNEYPPAEWTIVSPEEGYDLALGKGWHIQLNDFLTWYDPQKSNLVKMVNGKEEPLLARDLFIFYQKKLFKVGVNGMEQILAQRINNYTALEQWVAKYRETHDLKVYYEDDNIGIYHIHQSESDDNVANEKP